MVRPGTSKLGDLRAEIPLNRKGAIAVLSKCFSKFRSLPFPSSFHWAQDSTMETKVSWVVDGWKLEPDLSG